MIDNAWNFHKLQLIHYDPRSLSIGYIHFQYTKYVQGALIPSVPLTSIANVEPTIQSIPLSMLNQHFSLSRTAHFFNDSLNADFSHH